jgi:hypothetical protein
MRKTLIALFAIISIGFVSPTVASARGGFHGGGYRGVSWGGGWRGSYRWHGPRLVGRDGRRRLIDPGNAQQNRARQLIGELA